MNTVLRKIYNRNNKRGIIFTDSGSSMSSIKFNKENHPVLSPIYDILAEFKNQWKPTSMCGGPIMRQKNQ